MLLADAGVPTPRTDAELLVGHAVGLSRSDLALQRDRRLTAEELASADTLIARRVTREPLQYVLGEWGFRRLTLNVDRRALVPRPETEVVVARCLELLAGREQPRILDVGTGSGAIALALADEHPGSRVVGIDASVEALALAQENVARTGLAVELRQHDLFAGLPAGPWDLVVSNPPYVAPDELGGLEPDVRDWEPREALVGTGATEAVAAGALAVLEPGGALVLEVGDGTAPSVGELLSGARLSRRPGHPRPGRARPGRRRPGVSDTVERAVEALRAGEVVVIPTDTVYGLAAAPHAAEPVHRLYALKRRPASQPTALVAASVDLVLELVPELAGRGAALARALLPGPYTLVVPNSARRFAWLCGERADALGVRVPVLEGAARELLEAAGAVAATSANLPGGLDPRRLADVPIELLAGAAAAVDGGELPGIASTVLDLTGTEPRVLREGAVPAAEALDRAAAAWGSDPGAS